MFMYLYWAQGHLNSTNKRLESCERICRNLCPPDLHSAFAQCYNTGQGTFGVAFEMAANRVDLPALG